MRFEKLRSWLNIKDGPPSLFTLGALLILLLFLLLYVPLILDFRAERIAYTSLKAQLENFRTKVDYLLSHGADRAIISEGGISLAVDEITRRSEEKGVRLVSVTPGRLIPETGSRYRILPVVLETSSSYEAFAEFLGVFDQMDRGLFTVKEFHVSVDEKRPEKVRGNVQLNLYVAP